MPICKRCGSTICLDDPNLMIYSYDKDGNITHEPCLAVEELTPKLEQSEIDKFGKWVNNYHQAQCAELWKRIYTLNQLELDLSYVPLGSILNIKLDNSATVNIPAERRKYAFAFMRMSLYKELQRFNSVVGGSSYDRDLALAREAMGTDLDYFAAGPETKSCPEDNELSTVEELKWDESWGFVE